MPDITSAFRGAVMGGFRRGDVVDYIEKLTATHRAEMNALRRELGEVSAELTAARSFSSGIEEKLNVKHGETETLADALGRVTAERDALRAELEAKSSEAGQLGASLAEKERLTRELGEKADALAEELDGIERSKIYVANIELAAYERAREIENTARESAGRAMEALTRLYGDARHRFDRARAEAETSITNISGELERVHSTLGALVYRFEEISAEMSGLRLDDAVLELLGGRASGADGAPAECDE